MPFVWIREEVALALHDEQLAEHGGASGLRDSGALASALMRPRTLLDYGETRIAALAAAYATALQRNHPFVDGNKRVGFVLMELFLELNGCRLEATDAESVTAMLALAAGRLSETDLIAWLESRIAHL